MSEPIEAQVGTPANAIAQGVGEQQVVTGEFKRGTLEISEVREATAAPWTPLAGAVSPLLKIVAELQARIDLLEKRIDALEFDSAVDANPKPTEPVVNQVQPPTALVPKNQVHYDLCDECGQAHDGTGRFMDQRGKLIAKSKVKKCSQP